MESSSAFLYNHKSLKTEASDQARLLWSVKNFSSRAECLHITHPPQVLTVNDFDALDQSAIFTDFGVINKHPNK